MHVDEAPLQRVEEPRAGLVGAGDALGSGVSARANPAVLHPRGANALPVPAPVPTARQRTPAARTSPSAAPPARGSNLTEPLLPDHRNKREREGPVLLPESGRDLKQPASDYHTKSSSCPREDKARFASLPISAPFPSAGRPSPRSAIRARLGRQRHASPLEVARHGDLAIHQRLHHPADHLVEGARHILGEPPLEAFLHLLPARPKERGGGENGGPRFVTSLPAPRSPRIRAGGQGRGPAGAERTRSC